MEHVHFSGGHCASHRRRVHARLFHRWNGSKFGGRVGGVRLVKRRAPQRMVGLLCDWFADRLFITAIGQRRTFVFARAQHAWIRAWIVHRDRVPRLAFAPQHVDRVGHDLCVVTYGQPDLGFHLEHARNCDRWGGAVCWQRHARTWHATGLVSVQRHHWFARWLGAESHILVVGISRRRSAQILIRHLTIYFQ